MPGTSEGGKKAAAKRGHESLSQAGRKGALARTHEERVRSGKKAAITRGYESLSAAGRKGGQHSHRNRKNREIANSFYPENTEKKQEHH